MHCTVANIITYSSLSLCNSVVSCLIIIIISTCINYTDICPENEIEIYYNYNK